MAGTIMDYSKLTDEDWEKMTDEQLLKIAGLPNSLPKSYDNPSLRPVLAKDPERQLEEYKVRYTANLLGHDPHQAAAVAMQESGFNPNATSPTGVKGTMQLTKRTGESLGFNRDNPDENIIGGVMALKKGGLQGYPDPNDYPEWSKAVNSLTKKSENSMSNFTEAELEAMTEDQLNAVIAGKNPFKLAQKKASEEGPIGASAYVKPMRNNSSGVELGYQEDPRSLMQVFKESFGNTPNNAPTLTEGMSSALKMSNPLYNLYQYGKNYSEGKRGADAVLGEDYYNVANASGQIPETIAELPATALQTIPYAGEVAREGIGEMLGTYKRPQEYGTYWNPDIRDQTILSAGTIFAPEIIGSASNVAKMAGKIGANTPEFLGNFIPGMKNVLKDLPEKIYAKGARLSDLISSRDLAEKEIGMNKIRNVLNKDLPVLEQPFYEKAKSIKQNIGKELEQKLEDIGPIDISKIIDDSESIIESAPSGYKKVVENKVRKFQEDLANKSDNFSIPAKLINEEKKYQAQLGYKNNKANKPIAAKVNQDISDILRNSLRDNDVSIGRSIDEINQDYEPFMKIMGRSQDVADEAANKGVRIKSSAATHLVDWLSDLAHTPLRGAGKAYYNLKNPNYIPLEEYSWDNIFNKK